MKRHIHFLGIAGSGASAAAAIAQAQGFEVSGCDNFVKNEFTQVFTDDQLLTGHSPEHLKGVDTLAITPAVLSLDPNNAELRQAQAKGLEVLTWQQFMGKYLEANKQVIAICGTHGKSTTTAMTAKLLEEANFDPTVELGAIVADWNANYRIGHSEWFITEADEFNNNFLVSHPDYTIVTNIQMDHPEFFADFEEYQASFIKFLSQTKKLIIANMSDPGVGEVIKKVMKQSEVTVMDYSKSDFNLTLKIPGEYNVSNASAVFQLGLALGITPERIKQSLEDYSGLGRRQELLGEVNGAQIYTDFGHHPTEISQTILGFHQSYANKKLIMVWQPHMFSRTKALFADFVSCLRDLPIEAGYVLDIYPSREVDTGLVSSQELVQAVGDQKIKYESDINKLKEQLKSNINSDDLVIFMGAGSVDQWAREFVKQG